MTPDHDDQPHVDHWPNTAPLDIEQARPRLARKFNRKPVR
jgi:hypothetical protein